MSIDDLWMDLATAISASERMHRDRAEQLWRDNDALNGLRLRGVADGLDIAQEHMLRLAAEARGDQPMEPAAMDGAMHSVWLHGKWRWLTSKMTAEQRETAADAVQRYSTWLNRQDDELSGEVLDLRWWQ